MKSFFRSIFRKVKMFFNFLWRNFKFSHESSKLATIGLLIFSTVLVVSIGAFLNIGWHPYADPFLGVLLVSIIFFLSGAGVLLGFQILRLLPRFFKDWGILLFGGAVIVFMILFEPMPGIPFGLSFVIIEALFFVSLFTILFKKLGEAGLLKKIWIYFCLVLGLFVNTYVVYWLQKDGFKDYLVDLEEVRQKDVKSLKAENPAIKGSYEVQEAFYGSGNFRNRPEYGEDADVKTETVDGTEFLTGNSGFKIKVRNFLMGFDHENLPLNGHVWYPEGEGPFPLVLTVHGNHSFAEFSDPGYAYLGEHLASKGYIMVSVDENFLNGAMVGGLDKENDARAWMLLLHLRQWHEWNRTDTSMFFNLVDTSNIALIGHSRGGEAVAIAGNFNRLPFYPDNAKVKLGFDYAIRSIIAIAPSDGQYKPAGKPNELKDVNYFVIQGAHDADVSYFMGMRQYHRTKLTKDSLFKASLYSYRSNHGQFNSIWGNTDYGWPMSAFLNKKPLLEEEEQRQIAKVYLTAFLEATIKGERDYMPMFRDHRYASEWLPADVYISRYEDNSFVPLCTFDEDVDVTTGTQPGVEISVKYADLWKEHDLSMRKWSTKKNNALTFGWMRDTVEQKDSLDSEVCSDSIATYRITFSDSIIRHHGIDSTSMLVFSAANTEETIPEEDEEEPSDSVSTNNANEIPGKEKKENGEKEDKEKDDDDTEEKPVQVDFSIKITDSNDQSAVLPLSEFAYIPPVLKSKFVKLKSQNDRYGSDYEVTLQDFRLPLKAFIKKNPELTIEKLERIELIFDQMPEGVVVLDAIGFEK